MSLRDELAAGVLDNDQARGFTRQYWQPEHYAARPPLTPGRSILTSAGGVDLAKRIRYIRPEAWPVSDTEIAQAYLTVCRMRAHETASGGKMLRQLIPYRKPLPPPWPRIPGPPSYCYPFRDEPYVRADFVACYARLYLGVTPDCFYRPDRQAFLSGRMEWWRRDEWLELKGPRNRAWGLMERAPFRVGADGTARRGAQRLNRPRTFAPHCVAFTMACLAAVSHVARARFGAVYWRSNDEVWLPAAAVDEFRIWLRTAWRLELHEPEEVPAAAHSQARNPIRDADPDLDLWLLDTWRWSDDARQSAQLRERVPAAAGTGSRARLHLLQGTAEPSPPDSGAA